MAKFDMNAMLKQAQQMQAQMMEAQEQARQEVVEASAGGGMVTVKANGGGEIVEIRIDPKAIDPDDPEMLADIVMAAANEALAPRASSSSRRSGARCPTWEGSGSPACARPDPFGRLERERQREWALDEAELRSAPQLHRHDRRDDEPGADELRRGQCCLRTIAGKGDRDRYLDGDEQ